jgi:spermidine synthase
MKGEKYDLILCDLPEAEAGGPVAQLYSQSFFALLRNCLTPLGIYAGHMGSLQRSPSILGPQALLPVAAATLEWVMPYVRYLPSHGAEWVFAVGGMAARAPLPSPAEVDARLLQRRDPAWPLQTYDGGTHQRLFTLSKDVRLALARPRR